MAKVLSIASGKVKEIIFGYNYVNPAGNYSILVTDDIIEYTSSSSFTATLPAGSGVKVGKPFFLKNNGTGYPTFTTTGGELIDDATSLKFGQFHGYMITWNGTKYIVLNFF